MKFYYNGELVRTSENHVYSHVVLYDGKVVSCCGSYDLARKEMSSRISRLENSISDSKLAIAAIDRGERSYWTKAKCGRYWKSFRVKIDWSRDEYLEIIAKCEDQKTKYGIVELEAR